MNNIKWVQPNEQRNKSHYVDYTSLSPETEETALSTISAIVKYYDHNGMYRTVVFADVGTYNDLPDFHSMWQTVFDPLIQDDSIYLDIIYGVDSINELDADELKRFHNRDTENIATIEIQFAPPVCILESTANDILYLTEHMKKIVNDIEEYFSGVDDWESPKEFAPYLTKKADRFYRDSLPEIAENMPDVAVGYDSIQLALPYYKRYMSAIAELQDNATINTLIKVRDAGNKVLELLAPLV